MKLICKTLCLALACGLAAATGAQADGVAHYINPFIGTGAVDASSLKGGTFPGATCPFGLVQLSPDVARLSDPTMGSGYDYNATRIYGFSHTHLSGTGIADLQDIQFMPTTRGLDELVAATDYSSAFDHRHEEASAGYYRVELADTKVCAELTATTRTGMHRYTYPASAPNNLVIDLTLAPTYRHKNERELYDAQIRVVGPTTVQGYRVVGGWARLRKIYFYAEFSRPIEHRILTTNKYIVNRGMFEADTLREGRLVNGNEVKAFLAFAPSATPLVVRVGLSAVSCDGARRNLEAENADFDFDAVHSRALKAWEDALANIRIDGSEQQKRIFYTALYHAYVQPNTFSDVDGRYFSPDYAPASVPQGATQYTTFSLWDTFRAAHPLYTLLQPARVADMAGSMLRFFDAYGYLPIWQLWGSENYCMIGNHAIPVLVDAALKGIPGIDAERIYEAVRTTSTTEHYNADYHLLDRYGYFPVDCQSQAVSVSLETAFDDACVARLARALGKADDAAYFDHRAHLYRNLFDPSTGFFRGRLSNGQWVSPFNPLEFCQTDARPYTEGNAWQYRWFVPHDVPDLIELMGGPKKFEQNLDSLFSIEYDSNEENDNISGMIGQYVHGNEPSHHCIYLYDFVGADRKAQHYANRVLNEQYTDDHKGYSGNDDCGQMSAWYVFGAMGFYPVDPASGVYYFGSPQLRRVRLDVGGGRRFVITTNRTGADDCYIKKVKLNGRVYKKNYITHADLMAGGTLEFTMGRK